jgi:hypothetical protein
MAPLGFVGRAVRGRALGKAGDELAARLTTQTQATIDLVVRTRGRAIMAAVDVERLRHPQLSDREFTEWLVARKTHVVTSAGATSALPGVFPIVGATAEISAALADAAFLIYEQVTLILEIAHVHGRDVRDVEPRTLDVILVLALDAGVAVPRGKDIEVLGERVSASVIPRDTIAQVNRRLGLQVARRLAQRRANIILRRTIPFGIGVVVAALFNHRAMRTVSRAAVRYFELG